jgi:thiamine phosphate synthase YjbQ (UPF0047 family)
MAQATSRLHLTARLTLGELAGDAGDDGVGDKVTTNGFRTHRSNTIAKTSTPPDIVDITDDVRGATRSSGLSNGHVTISTPPGGCALVVNERESGLLEDMKAALDRMSSRIGDVTVGRPRSTVLPLVGGELRLGAWQRIMLVELEEPAERTVIVEVVGE